MKHMKENHMLFMFRSVVNLIEYGCELIIFSNGGK